jgi:membrane protease YdiL (CAAX protease family)
MRVNNNREKIEKTRMEGDVSRLGLALMGYLFITSFISLIAIFITGADINGFVYIVSSVVGILFIGIFYRNHFDLQDVLYETREIPPKVFINALIVIIGIQPIFQLISQGIANIFLGFNYELTYSSVDASASGAFFIMFNMVIIKPIIEEIIFRGVVLRNLEKYGRNFAIVTSSVLFGVYHASLIQNGYGFVAGLVLAYITTRYSIKWAIILHCTNNMLMMIIAFLKVPFQINYLFLGIFLLWGLLILIVKRRKIFKYFADGRPLNSAYKNTFTNMYVLAFLALTVILTLLDINIASIYE